MSDLDTTPMLASDELPTGKLTLEYIRGKTVVTTSYARYPLKFVSATRAADRNCAWVYALGYGGGAVCGDHVSISCIVGEGCTTAVTTQGSTKVYKRGSQKTSQSNPKAADESTIRRAAQSVHCCVMKGGMIAMVPDPITCFKDASFKQHQRFMLEQGASLVLVDWLTSGRMSRGEGWDFTRLESRNEIMVQTSPNRDEEESRWEPLMLDSLVLEELPDLSIRERMLGMNVVGVVVLLGPRVEDVTSPLLAEEARQRSSLPRGLRPGGGCHGTNHAQNGERCLSSVSRLRGGYGGWCSGLVYRFAAKRTEDARQALHSLLLPLRCALGGKAPYATDGDIS